MGFGLGNIVKAATAPVAVANLAGIGAISKATSGDTPDTPVRRFRKPVISDELTATRDAQFETAKRLRDTVGERAEQGQNIAYEDLRRNLATQMRSDKANASQRGLLYSGAAQGQAVGRMNDFSSELVGQRAALNAKYASEADDAENNALATEKAIRGIQLGSFRGDSQEAARSAYKDAIERRSQSMQNAEQIGSGIGSLVGAGYGSAGSQPMTRGNIRGQANGSNMNKYYAGIA